MATNEPGSIDVGGPERFVGSLFADKYRLTRFLSAGANTVIFDADEVLSGRPVTLKIVRPDLAVTPTFRERFDSTIRSVAAMSHPNIAAVYDWGAAPFGANTTVFVVIEQLTGGSVRDLYDRGRRLSPSQALMVGLDVCRGLDHAHRRGFVHGELTPSKLVFGDDRRLRIVDFGLAGLLGELAWHEPATVATHVAKYASPEQSLSLPIDGKTDVYALCLTLVEGVTGSLPFEAESTVATLAARVGKLMTVSADLGPLAAVLEKAGRPEPEDRSSAAEFGRALVRAAEKLPRPEPLPLLSSAVFDTPVERLRSPDDPTGGVVRPEPGTDAAQRELVVVPLDEPDATVDAEPDTALGEPTDADRSAAHVDTEADTDVSATVVAYHDELPPAEPGSDLVIVPVEADDGAPTLGPPSGAPVTGPVSVGPDDVTTEITTEVDRTVAGDEGETGVRRRRAWWKLIVPLLLIAIAAALGFLAYRLFSTPSYAVADLTGMPESAALAEIDGNGWEVSIETERNDEERREGYVIRTVPSAGVELAEGEPFLVVVSEGPVLRVLPDVGGASLADAQTTLIELELGVSVVEQPDEDVPEGQVISWSVPADPTLGAGAEVLPDTEVQIVVSTGPAPRTVPDLAGVPFADAQGAIEAIQLTVAEGDPVFHDVVPAGNVVSQVPEGGAQVERGSTVEVVLSRGPDVVAMPDLTNFPYEEAISRLTEAGFVPILVLGSTDGTILSAAVGGQQVNAGDVFPRGTQVDLVAL